MKKYYLCSEIEQNYDNDYYEPNEKKRRVIFLPRINNSTAQFPSKERKDAKKVLN